MRVYVTHENPVCKSINYPKLRPASRNSSGVPGASANPQMRRRQTRQECGLAAERHDFHCPKAVRRGCLLVAESRH